MMQGINKSVQHNKMHPSVSTNMVSDVFTPNHPTLKPRDEDLESSLWMSSAHPVFQKQLFWTSAEIIYL
jgi:hypothetical protein